MVVIVMVVYFRRDTILGAWCGDMLTLLANAACFGGLNTLTFGSEVCFGGGSVW